MQKWCWTRRNRLICCCCRDGGGCPEREARLPFSVGAGMFDPVVVDKSCSRHDPIMHNIMRNQSGNLQLWTLLNPVQRFTARPLVEPEPAQIILAVSDQLTQCLLSRELLKAKKWIRMC